MTASDIYPDRVIVELRGHHEGRARMTDWCSKPKSKLRSQIRLALGHLQGTAVFDLATGYGLTKGITEWRIRDDCLAELLAWAEVHGRHIGIKPKPPVKATRRRVKKKDPRQGEMF